MWPAAPACKRLVGCLVRWNNARMLTHPARVVAVLAMVSLAYSDTASPQRKTESAEQVIRSLVLAMYGNDVASYNSLTIPHPMRNRLTAGGRVNESKLEQLKQDPGSLQVKEERPPMFRGAPVEADGRGEYPVGTTALFIVAHGGSPMVVTLARREDGWKVDLRWWIAMMELASGREPAAGGADVAIRSLLASMLRLDRAEASRFVVPGADMNVVFDGAPRQREPSGVLDATVFEMPLVAIEPGEFARTASGKVVEGTRDADRKVVVGLFGPVEIPFVVRRLESRWRVEAEPFFSLMMR
jgi:hypothetical protein